MKVESILIKNFKRFEQQEVSFKNQTLNTVSNRFLVLGDNLITMTHRHLPLLEFGTLDISEKECRDAIGRVSTRISGYA